MIANSCAHNESICLKQLLSYTLRNSKWNFNKFWIHSNTEKCFLIQNWNLSKIKIWIFHMTHSPITLKDDQSNGISHYATDWEFLILSFSPCLTDKKAKIEKWWKIFEIFTLCLTCFASEFGFVTDHCCVYEFGFVTYHCCDSEFASVSDHR